MPSHLIGEESLPSSIIIISADATAQVYQSILADTKQQIVHDLHCDRRACRAVYVPELAMVLAFALVLSIIASAGLAITIVGFGTGQPSSELAEVVKVLVTGTSSLVTAGVLLMLRRFQATAKTWLREEQRRTTFINLIRMGNDLEDLRLVLNDYWESARLDEKLRPKSPHPAPCPEP